MASTIEDVLKELDAWYNELPGGTERPKLLSKLATLELCGWLEERIDVLASAAASRAGVAAAAALLQQIRRTYGFSYSEHMRPLLVAIGGEMLATRAEAAVDKKYPGDMDRLRTTLGQLWQTRKMLAHASFVGTTTQQITLNAPSWSINQQRVLGKLIGKLEQEVLAVISTI